jgi:penicillin-binding protein 1A
VTEVRELSFDALTGNGKTRTIELENMAWAQRYIAPNNKGPEPTSAGEVVSGGDIVYIRKIIEGQWMLSQIPEVSGALVCLDSNSGAILALTGGFDFYLSKFNRATQAQRQPGSNIKPFIYSAALDNGFTPSSLVSAAPIVIEDDLEGIWRPQNYSKKFFGPTRLRKALTLSLNLVSVRLLRAMGIDATVEHLVKFGFDNEQLPRNLSLALGSTTVTPLQLAASFAVFANGGSKISPYLIESITDADGNTIELPSPTCEGCNDSNLELTPPSVPIVETISVEISDQAVQANNAIVQSTLAPVPVQSISPQNAFLTRSMLKQVILSGTGRRALSLNRSDLAGKTGTTNNFRDAWFSGFTPDVNTTVFVGFDEPSHLGKRESGASAALPIWIDFMERVLQDYPQKAEIVPVNITTRFINKDTALVTSLDDPDGFTEYYELGTEPNNLVEYSSSETGPDEEESVAEDLF